MASFYYAPPQLTSVSGGIFFVEDINTGLFNPAPDQLGLVAGGTTAALIKADGSVTFYGDAILEDNVGFTTTLDLVTPTAARTITYPNASGTVALVAGSNGQVQFNNDGALAGSPNLTYSLATGLRTTLPFGYATGVGAGGAVTQATSKSTGVTLNTSSGDITLSAESVAANTTVSFTLTNSNIAATDLIVVNHVSGGTNGSYLFGARAAAGTALMSVRNVTASPLAEAVVLRFALIKAANT